SRPAFASLTRTMDDLTSLADGRIEELPPAFEQVAAPALVYLERTLFSEQPPADAPPLDGALRFFEAAGARGVLELVGEELLSLIRAGTAPEEIGIVCSSVEHWQAPLETALGTLGVPYAPESYVRLDKTSYGQALLSLLRFAWLGGGRAELYAFLRSPYSGLSRQNVDFLEGRLRGRAVNDPERVEEETVRLRDGQPLPALEALRAAPTPLDAVAGLGGSMLRAAYGLESPPVGEVSRQDIRAPESVMGPLRGLRGSSEPEGLLPPGGRP